MRRRSVEILAAVVLFVSTSPVMAVTHFRDGGIHNIDYFTHDVWVDYESPGRKTTLNILDGATIPYPYYIRGYEDSIINILGGSMYDLNAFDSSKVTVSGGSINSHLDAYNSSQVTVSGGSMDGLLVYNSSQAAVSGGSMGLLVAYHSSQVTVSGGSINNYLQAAHSSQVTISGGSMGFLFASSSSQVTVSGGSMGRLGAAYSSQVAVSGGSIGGEFQVWNTAVLTIHGSDFAVNGTLVGYTELYSIFGGDFINEPDRQLTGTLLSGDPINNQFRIGDNAKIVLVPEPATLLLLGLGGLALLRNRRFR